MKNYLNTFRKANDNNILVDELIAANSADWFLKNVLEVEEKTYNKYFDNLAEAIWGCYIDAELNLEEIENNMYEYAFEFDDEIETRTESEKIALIKYVISKLDKIRSINVKMDEILED